MGRLGLDCVLLTDNGQDESPPDKVWHLTTVEGGGWGRMTITIEACAYSETQDTRKMKSLALLSFDPEDFVAAVNLMAGRTALLWVEPDNEEGSA